MAALRQAWHIRIAGLRTRHPDALALLRILACAGSSPVPAELLVKLGADFDEPELATAVRAANAVATAYLAHRDRVGLVSFGGLMRWLRPGMGARQQYVIVDMLLGTSVFDSVAWRDIDAVPPKALPPKALVIALSPLLDRRAIGAIIDLRRRGIDVVVVEVSPLPFAPATPGVNGEVAHRLWQLQRALVRDRFAELGVPVVVWDPRRALAVTIEEIAAWPTARRLVR